MMQPNKQRKAEMKSKSANPHDEKLGQSRTWGGHPIPDGKDYHVVILGERLWDEQSVLLIPTDLSSESELITCEITDLQVEGENGSRRCVITITERADSESHDVQ